MADVDYDALASKYGGGDTQAPAPGPKVDYDAIAAKYGAAQEKRPAEPNSFDRIAMIASRLSKFTPMGALSAAGERALDSINKIAYEAGGMTTDVTGSPVAGAAVNMAGQAVPAAVGGVAGLVARAPLRAGAEAVMQSALKPSMKALKLGKGDQAVGTLLDEGINVSRGGAEKLQDKVIGLNDQITQALQNSGATVDRDAVAARLQDVISRIEHTSMNPQDRVAAVQHIYDQVITNPNIGRQIPVKRAQEIKQGIYQVLKDKYGQLGSDEVESQKALARGLKEEIASAVPGVHDLNAYEGELLNAMKLVEHRALQAGNHNLAGLALLTHDLKGFSAFMADRSPLFKSMIARMINAGSEAAPAVGAAAGAAFPQKKE